MRRAVALVAVAAITAAVLGWAGASASPTGGHRVRNLRLVATNSYFVDNDPSGQSGGDLIGSSGELRRRGHRAGKYSSACTLALPVAGQCQATLILRRGRIQLAGNYRLQAVKNRVAIVGGTNKFRGVRGDVTIETLGGQGAVQRLHLTLLR